MKRAGLIIILLVLVLVGIAIYYYFNQEKIQKLFVPEVKQVEQLGIKVTGDTARMMITLNFRNGGPFKMNIDSVIYKISFDTATLLSRAQDIQLVLRPGESGLTDIPLHLPYKRLMQKVKSVQNEDSVDIETDVRIVYATVFGNRAITDKRTHTIAVPRPPEFELEKVEYLHRHHKELFFSAHIKMKNPGKLKLDVAGLKYKMKVADLFDAAGVYDSTIMVRPRSVITKELLLKVRVKNVFKTAYLILVNKDKVPYHLTIDGTMQADMLGKEPMNIQIVKDGILEIKK